MVKSFGATCWGSDPTMHQPGCRVYVTTPNGFQQYISDSSSIAGWTKDSNTISYGSGVTAMDGTPMTVLNNYDVGGTEITIFFVTKSNQIACQTHSNGDFQLWTVPETVTGTPKFMTSVTWKNTDGRESGATSFRHVMDCF